MSIVKCDAANCAHNGDCKCEHKHIKICCENREMSCLFCASFRPKVRAEASLLKQEIGLIDIAYKDTDISCSATGCVHNLNRACKADMIKLVQSQRQDRAYTCASYKPRSLF